MTSLNKQKRILIFSTAYLPLVGGAELAVKNLAEQLPDYKFDLITAKIQSKIPRHELIGGIDVYRVGWGWKIDKLLLPLWGTLKAIKLNRHHQYPIIWSIMASYGGFAAYFFKCLNPQKHFLLTLQEGDDLAYIRKRIGPFFFLFKKIFQNADYIQAISSYLAKWATDLGAKCPIAIVPNGVNLEIFKSHWKSDNLNKRIIISVSRLVEKNGLSDVIKAMPDIDGELWLVGDGPLAAKLKALASDLQIVRKVRFFGSQTPDQVANLLAQASVFIRPSRSEGLGNAFLEAMAVGLPTVATPVGGIVDFLSEGETGWICQADSSQDIAKTINWILDGQNQPEVSRIAGNGRSLARTKYDWRLIADSFDDIFNKLLQPKIIIATGIYPPDIGGPATIVEALKRSLAASSLRVRVITYASNRSFSADIVRVKKNSFFSKLSYGFHLFRMSLSADLIYVTDTYSVGYFAYLIKRMVKKPYIVRFAGDSAWETSFANNWTRDYIIDFQTKVYSNKIERLKARRTKILTGADAIIAVSEFMAQVAGLIGVPGERIKIIYNSVDFEEKNTIDRRFFLKQYGIIPEEKIIMTACRLTPWKGVDGLIRAMADLRQTLAIKLVILGDGPELGNLRLLAKNLGVEDSVIFAGSIKQKNMIGYLALADVFVLNTYYEGLSHTLLEAMKAGVPVIASKSGGNPEVIVHGKTGWLIDYNDVEQLKSAISFLIENPDVAANFSTNLSKSQGKFSWARVVEQTDNLINQIV